MRRRNAPRKGINMRTTVVSGDGTPKTVFHGSPKTFRKFVHTDCLGFHFGTFATAKAVIEGLGCTRGGCIRPYVLFIKRALRLPDLCNWIYDDVVDALRDVGVLNEKTVQRWNKSGRCVDIGRALRRRGYDGIVYRNEYEGRGDSYIVFSNRQIKAAQT